MEGFFSLFFFLFWVSGIAKLICFGNRDEVVRVKGRERTMGFNEGVGWTRGGWGVHLFDG